MPVATQASIKGMTYDQLRQTGCMLCLNNTYHLGLKPGQDVLDKVGGAHKLQGWERNILTDSGGYVSILIVVLVLIYGQVSDGVVASIGYYYRGRSSISEPP